ncbi:MAG: Cof-type HAD-IIB family hydrolase [Defluviitaleaceae bacterium]|nr:Cof-type HAD-IIB family hydrolase [Defluviitaleaceae bacterium]
MNIKLIVTDLDGTLLREDKTISDYTKSVLIKCREKGIKVVFATGRGGTNDQIVPAEFFDGRIKANGAVAKIGDKIVYEKLASYHIARPLLLACEEHGLKIALQAEDMTYSNFVTSDTFSEITNYTLVDISTHAVDTEKIILYPVDKAFVEKHCPKELYLTVSRDGFIAVMHKEATKAKALSHLAGLWDIEPSNIAAFGDDFNDLDMLSYAGAGVAMGDAMPDIKTAADFVTLSNEDDGVAYWIEKNIL